MNKRNLHIFSSIALSLSLLFTILFVQAAHSQVYNNEWLVSGQTYYKFKVGSDGLYRLSGSSLGGLAIAGTAASSFQLWHNGQQVPVYTSTTGVLGSGGYIEFWGEANDGSVDAELFRKPEDQLNPSISFEGDSATYFLTVNSNTAQNLRYIASVNDVAGQAGGLSAEPYFYYTTQQELGTTLNRGPATPYGSDYVYMSDYRGKSFGAIVKGGASKSVSFTNLFAYPGVSGTVRAGVSGSSPLGNNNRVVTVSGSDGSIVNGKLGNFASQLYVLGSAQVSSSYTVTVKNGAANTNDQINASFVSLRYPRAFNFGGQAEFSFDLAASSSMRYLKISGFNAGSSVPVLYDITGKKRYVAVVSGSDYQFVLPAMGASHLALVGQSTSSYTTIGASALQMRQYPDLTSSSQQGDYLIISNKTLYGSGNYVAQYSAYRSSAAGGSYITRIYNIDDLEDMFAFGIHSSPLSIRNFLRYARSHFSTPPKFVFLIGRGLSFDNLQGANASDPEHQEQNLVPTYGWPASDVMLSSANFEPVAATPIGRLSAVKPEEIKNYLDKVKAYEASQKSSDNTIENNSWKKNAVFISGGSNAGEEGLFSSYLNSYRTLLKDSLYGANSHYLSKVTSDEVSSTDANALKSYFSAGIGLISYFGHGASTTIGYGELNDPSVFNNNGRYPVMFTSGCDVGDCFAFMPGRISTINNITERYLFTKDKGSVAFIAQSYLGVTSFLQSYNLVMYKNLASIQYGQPISYSLQASQAAMITPGKIVGGDTVTAYAHAEQTNFLGDPAIRLNSFAKPDFVVQESEVYTPSSLSITENKFHVKAYLYNIGRAEGDTVLVSIKRKLPDGSQVTLLEKELPSIRYMDSLEVDVAVDPNKDAGNNEIIVSVDVDNRYNELSESNNSATKTVYIYANGITPVYPYNYSIIRSPSAVLIASTSDALAAMDTYVMELDTSEQFTSASKITKTVKSIGGALSFDPGISYKDSTVYYWRVSPVPKSGDGYRWAGSSFQYIAPAGSDKTVGAGQSQYYQHNQSILEGLRLDSVSRKFDFNNVANNFLISHAVYGTGIPTGWSNFAIRLNGELMSSFQCTTLGNSLMFNVFTPNGVQPYVNQAVPDPVQHVLNSEIGGFMGSSASCKNHPYSFDVDPVNYPNTNKYNFQFTYKTEADRNKIAQFMEWIPKGSYVIVRLFVVAPFASVPLVTTWKNDASAGGSTLYQEFLDQGLSGIEDFTGAKAGVFIYKKADESYIPYQQLTENTSGQIQLSPSIQGKDSMGYMTSPKFGPATSWHSVQWNGSSEESTSTDHATVDVIGISANGRSKVLYTLDKTGQNTNISSIDAAQYPYVQLKLRNVDSVNYTPYQLRYWHVLYTPVPEGALAGNIKLEKQDTIDLGQDLHFSIAFKNVSDQVFSDSIKATVSLRDKSNKLYTIPIRKLKKLNPGDTAIIDVTIPG
ncbi:MAG TPA: C25 family cysteine peptidase, partial [Arachidicoccus sp.]|nr:C25 family cysteine peptidase [Arachidicoccus sp.]